MKVHSYVLDRDRVYGRDVRISAALTLGAVIAAFLFLPQPEVKPYQPGHQIGWVELQELPVTLKQVERPVVRHPSLPVADPNGAATDSTVGIHNFDDLHNTVVEPPPPDPVPYWKVEKKPVLIHQVAPEYPAMVRAAGIEGRVTISAVVDTLGNVARVEVLGPSGNSSLDAAALDAARHFRFTPGYQRDRPVPVTVAIPFSFRLTE